MSNPYLRNIPMNQMNLFNALKVEIMREIQGTDISAFKGAIKAGIEKEMQEQKKRMQVSLMEMEEKKKEEIMGMTIDLQDIKEKIKEQDLVKEYQKTLNEDLKKLRGELKKSGENTTKKINKLGGKLSWEMREILKEHQKTEADFKRFVAEKLDHIEKMEMRISGLMREMEETRDSLNRMNEAYSAVLLQFSEIHQILRRTGRGRNILQRIRRRREEVEQVEPSAPPKDPEIVAAEEMESDEEFVLPSYSEAIKE